RGRPGRDPVKARYDGGEGAAAGVVENLYRMQPGAGCHPDHTDAVVDRRCATSHVSAVPVSVVTLVVLAWPEGAVGAGHHVQIRVVWVDTGVQDGDVNVDAVVHTVDVQVWIVEREDAFDPGRHGLRGNPDRLVALD